MIEGRCVSDAICPASLGSDGVFGFLNKQKEDAPPGAPEPLEEIVVGDVVICVGPDLGEAALRGALGMIPSGVRVFLANQPVDFR